VVQGVGYPNPNRSHFASMAIWHTGRPDTADHDGTGWIGRGLDGAPATGSLLVGEGLPPVALRGQRSVASALEQVEDFQLVEGFDPRRTFGKGRRADDLAGFVRRTMLDAYTTADKLAALGRDDADSIRYPGSGLARRLQLVARLLKAGFSTRV